MKVLHIFSSKAFAGLERHVEELSFEQSKNNNVLVVGPKKFKNKFRANYHSLDNYYSLYNYVYTRTDSEC